MRSVRGATDEHERAAGQLQRARRAPRTANTVAGSYAFPTLVVRMFVAVAAVAGLAYWDARREARVVFSDFAEDQAWLSEILARTLRDRLAALEWQAREAARDMTTEGRNFPSGLRLSIPPSPIVVACDKRLSGSGTEAIVELPKSSNGALEDARV